MNIVHTPHPAARRQKYRLPAPVHTSHCRVELPRIHLPLSPIFFHEKRVNKYKCAELARSVTEEEEVTRSCRHHLRQQGRCILKGKGYLMFCRITKIIHKVSKKSSDVKEINGKDKNYNCTKNAINIIDNFWYVSCNTNIVKYYIIAIYKQIFEITEEKENDIL